MPAENRVKTYTEYPGTDSEVEGSELNESQDKSTFLYAATEEVVGLPAWSWRNGTGFAGATVISGEYTIAANADEVLDNDRDWRDRQCLMFIGRVNAANRLPSGANHTWNNVDEFQWTHWNTQDGVAIGGAFAADDPWWKPFGGWDFHIYADSTNGYLYASEDDGAARYFYWIALLTGATE